MYSVAVRATGASDVDGKAAADSEKFSESGCRTTDGVLGCSLSRVANRDFESRSPSRKDRVMAPLREDILMSAWWGRQPSWPTVSGRPWLRPLPTML